MLLVQNFYVCLGLPWNRAHMALQAPGFPKGTLSDGAQEKTLVSVMAQHTQRNASLVSQMLTKSAAWSGPICAVSFTSERQEWKPENSSVAFGCHTEASHGNTFTASTHLSQPGTLASAKDAKKSQPNHSPSPHKFR